MPVAALTVELFFPDAHSLKDKRSPIRPILDGSRRRFAVAAPEVGHHDHWQRVTLGMAAVSDSLPKVTEVLDAVERSVWSFRELEKLFCRRNWLELEGDEQRRGDQ